MGDFFIGLINHIISGLGTALTVLVGILPNSPIQAIDNSAISQYLGCINWIIPVSDMLAELSLFCAAVLIYYAIQIVLRWIKVVE